MANFHPFQAYNADNFGGTYTFASLADYEVNKPTLFTLATGNPMLSFQQNDYAWLAQYERRIGNVSVLAGVRHEFQSGVSRFGNLAPRLAIAYAPGRDRRTVIRAGAGVFYDRRPPPLLEQALRYNGIQTQQYIVTNPPYPLDQIRRHFQNGPIDRGVADRSWPDIPAGLSGQRNSRTAVTGWLCAGFRLHI